MKKIQNYDRIYSAALTVRGEVVESPDVEAPYMGSPHKEWVLSLQGERHALVETLLDRDLTYRAPSEYEQFGDDLLGISFDEEDNLFRHFFTSKAVSYESDRSATVEVSTIVQISPDGKIQSEKESRAVMRYGAGDYTLAFPIKKLLWAMGRGYGPYLDKASEVSDAENGLLTLVAEGTCISPEHFGKWELTLDPKAQYLVRNAKFFPRLDASNAYVTITTTDPVTTGSAVYPTTGKCVMHFQYDATSEYSFSSVVFEADQSVFDEARSRTDNLSSARTLTMDHTVVPTKTDYVSDDGVIIDRRPLEEVKNPHRTWIIIINIVLVILLILFFVVRKFRR